MIHSLEKEDAPAKEDLKDNEDGDAEGTSNKDEGSKEDSGCSSEAE